MFHSQSHSTIESAIRLLKGLNPVFMSKVAENFDNLSLSDDGLSIYFKNLRIVDNFEWVEAPFSALFGTAHRLLLPRISNDKNNFHKDPGQCLESCFDSFSSQILSGLTTPKEYSHLEDEERVPFYFARTVIAFGAPALIKLYQNNIPDCIDRIIVLETDPRHLALALKYSNLNETIDKLKAANIGLQLFVDENVEVLKRSVRERLVYMQPTALNGCMLISSPVDNPDLRLVESWARSPEGLTQTVVSGFGSEVDELNQLIQSIVNALLVPNRKILKYQNDLANKPIVLVASGPSLDKALPWLKKHNKSLQIVAAGSSLGTLVRNDIQPAAVVFLERSSLVYTRDLHELQADGYDIKSIPLIASMTLDPRIAGIFKSVSWFHRPVSTALAFFPEEAYGKLLQSGPQSANAAIEALMHLGYRKFMLIGCDFSAEKRSYPRSRQALGESPRNFTLPVSGRNGKTVFSTPELFDCAECFANALRSYNPQVFSTSDGIKFRDYKVTNVSLDDHLACDWANSFNLRDQLACLPEALSLDEDEFMERLNNAKNSYLDLSKKLCSLVSDSNGWDVDLARGLDDLLKFDESGLTPSKAMVKRLCHYPLFISVQPLHDSTSEIFAERKDLAMANLKWLDKIYVLYFDLLKAIVLDVKNSDSWPFSWEKVKSVMLEKLEK